MSGPCVNTTESLGPQILLLAADDLLFPSRIREAVRSLGYVVQTAASLPALREKATTQPPVAILVNLHARGWDPPALIRGVKADPALRTIPLLAFAGHVETEKHAAARNAGADMVAANSSVSLHFPKLLARLLAGEHSPDVGDEG